MLRRMAIRLARLAAAGALLAAVLFLLDLLLLGDARRSAD